MKIIMNVLLLFLFSFSSLWAQEEEIDYDFSNLGRVTARSGLIMRKAPNASGEKIMTIPYQGTVFFYSLRDSKGNFVEKTEVIAGVRGEWKAAYYNGEYGYVFGAYLEIPQDYYIEQEYIYALMAKGIPIYKENNTKSEVLKKLSFGDEVYVLEPKTMRDDCNNLLIKVRYKEQIAYIECQYITPQVYNEGCAH